MASVSLGSGLPTKPGFGGRLECPRPIPGGGYGFFERTAMGRAGIIDAAVGGSVCCGVDKFREGTREGGGRGGREFVDAEVVAAGAVMVVVVAEGSSGGGNEAEEGALFMAGCLSSSNKQTLKERKHYPTCRAVRTTRRWLGVCACLRLQLSFCEPSKKERDKHLWEERCLLGESGKGGWWKKEGGGAASRIRPTYIPDDSHSQHTALDFSPCLMIASPSNYTSSGNA